MPSGQKRMSTRNEKASVRYEESAREWASLEEIEVERETMVEGKVMGKELWKGHVTGKEDGDQDQGAFLIRGRPGPAADNPGRVRVSIATCTRPPVFLTRFPSPVPRL